MGRGGKRGGRGRGGAGGGQNRPRPDNRTNKADIDRSNDKFEQYYNELGIIPEDSRSDFWDAMRRDLPNSFRFTGSKAHALAVQERLRNFYIPEITGITYEGRYVDAPRPVDWYPDQLAWYMTTPKNVIRRFKPFSSFQKFLVAETDVGNITRQEVVSMIPPLFMDLQPHMTVLDLCAAPGSKSAQLIEMIHAGEEERSKQVAANTVDGQEFTDDGRSSGLLIANDVDYKRAHMLVHQMKRLSSPNIIVTNHDATVFPSIKISSTPGADGKSGPNRYLKFDRILADVPCSGDGTVRKNLEIWKNWSPGNGLGLHATQVRILVRALQMLKVGGRVVYSTCSMNPVEDEAVLAEAISRCGGPGLVELQETEHLLPGLKRHSGLKTWNVMDKLGRIWNDYESVVQHRQETGDDALARLQESMFPPKSDLPLDRAVRVYPHLQDTGAFFIAILEKKSEIRAKPEDKSGASQQAVKPVVASSNGLGQTPETVSNGDVDAFYNAILGGQSPSKRKREEETDDNNGSTKRAKGEDGSSTETPKTEEVPNEDVKEVSASSLLESASKPDLSTSMTSQPQAPRRRNRDQPFEEAFKYLSPTIPELDRIWAFYNLSARFPRDRFMVRNPEGTPSKNIYYTNALAKEILQENEGKGLKFVHAGVKMFVKQDAPSPEVCPWRIQTDGMRLLETWVGPERIVTLQKKETLRKLLIEMFPRFSGDEYKNLGEVGEQVLSKDMGCCVLIVEPSEEEDGLSERMVFPLWKSITSLNLMLPKEDRRAMLLRLFNDDTPLVNLSKGWMGQKGTQGGDVRPVDAAPENKVEQVEQAQSEVRQDASAPVRRNSSSAEPGVDGEGEVEVELHLNTTADNQRPDEEGDGGVEVS